MHWSAFRNFVPSAIGRSRGWGVDCWRGAKRRKPTLIVLSSHRCCTKMQSHEWSPPWWWWWWWWLGWWLSWHNMQNMHVTVYHLNCLRIVPRWLPDCRLGYDTGCWKQLRQNYQRTVDQCHDENDQGIQWWQSSVKSGGEIWYSLCDENMMTKIFVKFLWKLIKTVMITMMWIIQTCLQRQLWWGWCRFWVEDKDCGEFLFCLGVSAGAGLASGNSTKTINNQDCWSYSANSQLTPLLYIISTWQNPHEDDMMLTVMMMMIYI